jgi:uncharacterized membrane protein YraQ (UPF0718 family)
MSHDLSGIHWLTGSLYAAAAMLWEMLWALVLGFTISACLQVFVRSEKIAEHFGKADLRSVGLATFLGAVSSSCSYAAASAAKTVLKKGANLVPALAFMFASTNLVLELGLVLWILLGWHFVLAEVVGSFVLIGIMWVLVALTLPRGLAEEIRSHASGSEEDGGCCHHGGHEHNDHDEHEHDDEDCHHHVATSSGSAKAVAETFFMDVGMMWKEILIGVVIAGFLMTLVPAVWWQALFLTNVPQPWRLIENALVGVLIAVASFTCSIGNIPLASLLWSGGISFGGVISFIYGDLVIIPLLLIYRKSYGVKGAAYIGVVLFVSMVLAGIIVDLLFTAFGLVPTGPRPMSPMDGAGFAWNYTTWLDFAALAVMAWFVSLRIARK